MQSMVESYLLQVIIQEDQKQILVSNLIAKMVDQHPKKYLIVWFISFSVLYSVATPDLRSWGFTLLLLRVSNWNFRSQRQYSNWAPQFQSTLYVKIYMSTSLALGSMTSRLKVTVFSLWMSLILSTTTSNLWKKYSIFRRFHFFFSVAVRTKILITSNLTKFLLIQDTKAHIRRIVGKAFPHSNWQFIWCNWPLCFCNLWR